MNVTCFGERHGNHKLTTIDVQAIRTSGEGTMSLSRRYGVNKRTIQRIRNGEERRHEP